MSHCRCWAHLAVCQQRPKETEKGQQEQTDDKQDEEEINWDWIEWLTRAPGRSLPGLLARGDTLDRYDGARRRPVSIAIGTNQPNLLFRLDCFDAFQLASEKAIAAGTEFCGVWGVRWRL